MPEHPVDELRSLRALVKRWADFTDPNPRIVGDVVVRWNEAGKASRSLRALAATFDENGDLL